MKPITLLILTTFLALAGAQAAKQSEWQDVEKVFGRKGDAMADMYKISLPRSDLKVTLGDIPIDPPLALSSWLAFKRMAPNQAMMMGDMVLLVPEVAPVQKALLAKGIEITAIHNHLLGTTPDIMYMHFGAVGEPAKLAQTIKEVLQANTATPLGPPAPTPQNPPLQEKSKIEAILGRTGTQKGRVIQFSFPRAEQIMENAMEVPPFIGTANAVNFEIVGDKAATTGDFVLIASEVNPVMKTLNENNITVTAVHNHMLNETPRLFFLHFWGYDTPENLAKGIKAALDNVNVQKKTTQQKGQY